MSLSVKELLLYASLKLIELNNEDAFKKEIEELNKYIQSESPILNAHITCAHEALANYMLAIGNISKLDDVTLGNVIFTIDALYPTLRDELDKAFYNHEKFEQVIDIPLKKLFNLAYEQI